MREICPRPSLNIFCITDAYAALSAWREKQTANNIQGYKQVWESDEHMYIVVVNRPNTRYKQWEYIERKDVIQEYGEEVT